MNFALQHVTELDLLIAALAAFVAGTCSGMTGFGGGLLLPPILAPILGVQNVVPVLSIAMLITNLHRFWLYRRYLDRTLTLAVLATMIPAVIIGMTIYLSLQHDTIALVLGTFLIASIPLGRFLARRRMQLGRLGLSVAGGCVGVVSGTTPGAGMLMIPVLLGAGLAGPAFLATDASISISVNFTKAIVFGGLGNLTLGLLATAVLIGLCTVPGNYLARWILQRTSLRLHARIMEVIVFFGGLSLLWRPVWDAIR
ncbi:MAG: sulfite exporter TauE/SafE family protein [Rhodospirillaceae bacterium]|nr:sulfite exporter TauE/SafE family protein [Rhodospirillaceae bacterium]